MYVCAFMTYVSKGKTVFFGGLARVDYVAGDPRAVYLTLFAANNVQPCLKKRFFFISQYCFNLNISLSFTTKNNKHK